MNRDELVSFLDNTLESAKFSDYSPNGLQVEGCEQVHKVVVGVTACQALLDEAVRRQAQAVIVHHGYFWKGESPRVVGYRRQRLATLIKQDINLLAYHLPLDAHPQLGNNAQWALAMGWQAQGRFGDQDIGWWGELPGAGLTLSQLAERSREVLGRVPTVVGDGARTIKRLAWCSGGAQGYMEAAAGLGVDAYLSGEISEQTTHVAREHGMAYLACGHHATERFGPRALAAHIRDSLGLDCEFVDVDNPA